MSKTILVPFDGSPESAAAVRHACERFADDDILVLYVVEPFAEHTEAGIEGYEGTWLDSAETYAEEMFTQAIDIADEYDVPIETAWQYGRPERVIVEYITAHDIDQVVMGSRGRSGVPRVLLGSVAETTLRRSTAPVTIVRDV